MASSFQRGDAGALLRLLSPLAARWSNAQIVQADRVLAALDVPSVDQLLTDSRLSLLAVGLESRLPQPHPREMAMMMPVLSRRGQQVHEEFQRSPWLRENPPPAATFGQFEDIFWDAEAWAAQLRQSLDLASYGEQLLQRWSRRDVRVSEQDRARIRDIDFRQLAKKLQADQAILERAVAVRRQQRQEFARQALDRESGKLNHLLAAYVIDSENPDLNARPPGPSSHRTSKPSGDRPPTDGAANQKTADDLRRESPDLVARARLLVEGLKWWTRGRYGIGPEGEGLLKSTLAMNVPDSEYGVFMPMKRPRAEHPLKAGADRMPRFERRHHAIWLFEYRRFQQEQRQGTSQIGHLHGSRALTQLSQFYSGGSQIGRTQGNSSTRTVRMRETQRFVTPQQDAMVRRLVGFLEYERALRALSEYVQLAKPEELTAVDQWIRRRDEFTVHTDLPDTLATMSDAAVQGAPTSPAAMPGAPPADGTRPKDKSLATEQRGFAWVLALARVELAAMLAAFTTVPSPFEVVGPSVYEGIAYRDLILDGLRFHHATLVQDPRLPLVAQMVEPNQEFLSLGRHLVLTRAFWNARLASLGTDPAAADVQQLAVVKADLDAVHQVLASKLQQFLIGTRETSQFTKHAQYSSFWTDPNDPYAILRGEFQELRAGTALIQDSPIRELRVAPPR